MKKYYSIDFFKSIAAFMVVCLHTKYPLGGGYVDALSRIAVPFFFLVLGYFTYNPTIEWKNERNKYIVKAKKHFILWISIVFVYFAIFAISDLVQGVDKTKTIRSVMSIEWLLGNIGMAGHLWFIRALIYIDLLLIAIGERLKKVNLSFILITLWTMDVILFKYSNIIFGFAISQPYRELITKYLGTAVLYFFIGWELKKKSEKIELIKIKKMEYEIFFICVFIVGNVAEYYMLVTSNNNLMPVNYLFTCPLILSIFIFLIRRPEFMKDSLLYKIGAKYSAYIYYWHSIIRTIDIKIVNRIGHSKNLVDNAFFLYLQMIILIMIFYKVKDKFKIKSW